MLNRILNYNWPEQFSWVQPLGSVVMSLSNDKKFWVRFPVLPCNFFFQWRMILLVVSVYCLFPCSICDIFEERPCTLLTTGQRRHCSFVNVHTCDPQKLLYPWLRDKWYKNRSRRRSWNLSCITRARWKVLAYRTTDVKLGKSGRWVGIRTETDVTSTLVYSFLVAVHGSMDIDGSILADIHGTMGCDQKSFTLAWRWHQFLSGSHTCRCPWSHGLWQKTFYTN